ncbi:MAG: MFS transporter [Terriglobales bacterium]|jgi:EmrB/QacA subfamily drug resistance transporter
MRAPCDEALLRSGDNELPCGEAAKPWILAATILGSSMAFIDSTVVNVALPAIQTGFRATVVDVQWVVESYGLFLGALILIGGSLGDLLGRRLIFIVGVAIFSVASAGCGFASNIQELIIARSVQGVGAALLVPGSLAIISTSFDENSRGQAIGTWSGFTAITTAVGPVLGGWLVEHASWRWAFFINLPIAAAVVVIALWQIPQSPRGTAERIDWIGALFATLGLGSLVYGFLESASLGWTNPFVFGSLIVGFGGLIGFVFVEARVTLPMVPLTLFRSRKFSGVNLLTLLLYAALGIFFFLFPLNLIQVQEYSPTAAGIAILPLILLMFLLSRWAGGLVAGYGARGPLILGPLMAATGFILFAVPSFGDSYWKSFFPAILVLGFGMTVTVSPLTTVVMDSVNEDRVGTASGINNAVARVAGVLAVAVLGIVMVKAFSFHLNRSLYSLSLPSYIQHELQANEIKLAGLQLPAGLDPTANAAIKQLVREAFVYGFRIVMLICAGLSLASAAVAWFMVPQGHDRPTRENSQR